MKMDSEEKASTRKFLVYGMPRLSAGIVLDMEMERFYRKIQKRWKRGAE